MRQPRLAPDPGIAACTKRNGFDMLADAFLNVTEIMRNHDVEKFTEEIGLLYSAITGNSYVLAATNSSQTSIVTKLRLEMSSFIDNRIKFIIDTVVRHIEKHFDLTDETMRNYSINDREISCNVGLNRHELQLVEFDILRMCDYVIQFRRLDTEERNLSDHEFYDVNSALKALIRQYRIISTNLSRPQPGRYANARIMDRNDNDMESTISVVMLGYMIARLTVCMILTREYDGIRCFSKEYQGQKDLVGDEYAKYSNMGSLQFSGIICCFKYSSLLPMAVVSDRGHLSAVEKQFLLNMLILSKLS